MDSTEPKGLAYLPIVVFTEGLLPLLSLKEVLRLRRVCKPLKSICDDHLRKNKCPSKTIVHLQEYAKDDHSYKDSLSKFLEFDATSSIRMQSHNFYLKNLDSIRELTLSFSTRYGAQIKHLSLERMELPFVSNSLQFQFFENLTNLSSLTLNNIFVQNDVNDDAGQEIGAESLPTCFKKNIKTFEVTYLRLKKKSDEIKFWETVGLFEKLECFRFPLYFIEDRIFPGRVFENYGKLIGKKSSNIKCFDLRYLDFADEPSDESLKLFSEQTLRNKIKWKNLPAWIFEKLYKMVWMPNAELIVSMFHFSFQNTEGLSFPNLVSLEFNTITVFQRILWESHWGPDWSKLPRIFLPSIYPGLRILKVTQVYPIDNTYLWRIWPYLTQLEEVSFEFMGDSNTLSSETFLGDNNEAGEPPFLRLIRLKKLLFHIPQPLVDGSNFNDAFHKAFRLMPLKEFIITSSTRIKSKIFDKDAILALCSPGPFIENIVEFPFRNWSMENVTDDEFKKLGRKFPNNHSL